MNLFCKEVGSKIKLSILIVVIIFKNIFSLPNHDCITISLYDCSIPSLIEFSIMNLFLPYRKNYSDNYLPSEYFINHKY